MGKRGRHGLVLATTIVAAVVAVSGARADERLPTEKPFAVEATPLVPLDAESAVSIVGIRGQISIETHDARELRVVSRDPGPEGAERPVGLWSDGSKITVAPAPGDTGGARQIRIEVPQSFGVKLDAENSDISIQSVDGRIDLHGRNVRAWINGSTGSLTGDLEGGSLNLRESSDATLKLRGAALDVAGMSGGVNVRATGGVVSLAKIGGAIDVECDDSELKFDEAAGSTHLKAKKGDATVARNTGPAELELSGTPLHLKGGKGEITVTSDAPVDFSAMVSAMHVDLDGASLRGKGSEGTVEARTRNTEVNVESLDQGIRVTGPGLNGQFKSVAGEVFVETSIGDIVVEQAGSVNVKVDRGNVTLKHVVGELKAAVTGGDVHIIDASGAVTLMLEGGDGDVSWSSISGDKDSTLTNKSGNLTVRFPMAGGGRIEASSQYGRIESDLTTVRVMDDSKSAQGPVNSRNRPIIHIVANGDIQLQDGSKVHDAD